ncbi:MAG: ribose 5-phosphate isomerase [Patescibacteria group bacterium]|nr:ribose 5-phosphate isomerase [Patescibacteria group bacterium]
MKIYIGTDHAGFELKEKLKVYLSGLSYEVVDKGPFSYDKDDDYPDLIRPVAEAVAGDIGSMGVILGGSGQGEAMCANRVNGARAAVFYGGASTQTDISGNTLDMIGSMREHNNANIISIGARFMTEDEVKDAVKRFLELPFSGDPRHSRRINKLDNK